MSTRSGKRIHNSPQNGILSETEASKNSVKTRSKRNKEERENGTEKKRKCYVKYPSEESVEGDGEKNPKLTRQSTRHTLKERNVDVNEQDIEEKLSTRQTRMTKKKENLEENANEIKDKKKSKKKKKKISNENENIVENVEVPKKKSNKKKNKKKSGSMIVEDLNDVKESDILNSSKMSVDSFHSATAGSPQSREMDQDMIDIKKSTPKVNKVKKHTSTLNTSNNEGDEVLVTHNVCQPKVNGDVDVLNTTYEKDLDNKSQKSRKRKSSIKNTNDDIEGSPKVKLVKIELVAVTLSNEKNKKKSKKSERTEESVEKLNKTFEKTDNLNATFDKTSMLDTTFEKSKENEKISNIKEKLDVTFEKDDKINTTFDKIDESTVKSKTNLSLINDSNIDSSNSEDKMNTTFEKTRKSDRTSEKERKIVNKVSNITAFNRAEQNIEEIMNTTFEKEEPTITLEKVRKSNRSLDKIQKADSFEKTRQSNRSNANTTFDKAEYSTDNKQINTTFEKEKITNTTLIKVRKSNRSFETTEKAGSMKTRKRSNSYTIEKLNTTFDKEEISTKVDKARKSNSNKTLEADSFEVTKEKIIENEKKMNTTYEQDEITNTIQETRKSVRSRKSLSQDLIEKHDTPNKSDKKDTFSKGKDTVFEKTDVTQDTRKSAKFRKSLQHDIAKKLDTSNKSNEKDTTFEKTNNTAQNTRNSAKFIKSLQPDIAEKLDASKRDDTFKEKDVAFEKNDTKDTTFEKAVAKDTTFEKADAKDSTFEKVDATNSTYDKLSISGSIMTSDTSKSSHISITDDESSDNIINTTPVMIDSSMDESHNNSRMAKSPLEINNSKAKSPLEINYSKAQSPENNSEAKSPLEINNSKTKSPHEINFSNTQSPENNSKAKSPLEINNCKAKSPIENNSKSLSIEKTPLKREGTFTKESPIAKSTTPRRKSLPSPGRTPFILKGSSKKVTELNVTHSIEKSRRSSIAEIVPRATRVMFCSPTNNPVVVQQMKGKVIKSNLKGSNKSFIFDDGAAVSSSPVRTGRKRSQTQDGAEPSAKRSRLLSEQPERAPRARALSAAAKLIDIGSPKKETPTKIKPSRTKLPNFAALHQKQFAKMESLGECQERKMKRAKQLLTPTGAVAFLERISPKESQEQKPEKTETKKTETPKSKSSMKPGYSRFGFKLKTDGKPFNFSAKNNEIQPNRPKLERQVMPSLTGATLTRKDVAKQTVMREKSFTDKRDGDRKENRTIIKGVRTNRRFELQMKMRNIN